MYDELTRSDLQKMQEEIDYRVQQLRPKLIEDVQTARAFGDLSENFEYKCAKQDKNRNDARIRYLQRMIKTARVIEDTSGADTAGLYDTVEIFMENMGKSRSIVLVTTLRQDALKGLISKESPVGRAVLGKRVGDRVYVDMGGGRATTSRSAPSARARTTAACPSAASENGFTRKSARNLKCKSPRRFPEKRRNCSAFSAWWNEYRDLPNCTKSGEKVLWFCEGGILRNPLVNSFKWCYYQHW